MHPTSFRRRTIPGRRPAVAWPAALIAVLALAGAVVTAQETGGPSPEEIEAFEREFVPPAPRSGGPDESAIERPAFEEPGTIPEDVRKQVPEAQIVAVYCAMTKWKSGAFFAAMDAVERLIIPAAAGLKDIGVAVAVPDASAIKAEGEKRVKAVCAAATVDEADRLVREFMAWGNAEGQEKFAAMRVDMRAKIQTYADAMRAEIKAALDPFIAERRAAITAEIDAKARELANQKSERFKSYKQPPSAAEINALKAEITRELQGLIDQKKAEVKAAVESKVQGIVGDRRGKLDAAAGAFDGMEQKMNAAIREGAAKYEAYRDEAIALRLKMVLGVLDASAEEGLRELEARAADVEEARRSDPDLPSVADVRASLAGERRELETKLEAALRAGDEAAFQAALADFRVRWQTYRAEMERAAKQSTSKVCAAVAAQFGQARSKIAQERGKLSELEAKCEGAATEECLKVNEFAPRFGVIESSLDDILLEMAVVEKMCQDPEAADASKLKALLDAIKAEADELKVYGEALQAEKSKVIAESAAQVCTQALPQLRAGKAEIEGSRLSEIEAELAKCKSKSVDLCADNTLRAHLDRAKALIQDFLDGTAKAEGLCASPDEETFQELRDLLEYLKGTGDKLRVETSAVRYLADQHKKVSKKQLCERALEKLDVAKRELSKGQRETASVRKGCEGKEDGRCAIIARSADKFAKLQERMNGAMGRIAEVEGECAAAGGEIDDAFIAKLDAIKADEEEIKKLKAEILGATDRTWPDHMRSRKPFKVILDVAPSKFDDKPWTGDWRTDQMGTIRGGETYMVTYAATGWQATGYNEATGGKGTWTYRAGDPDMFQLDIWGRVFSFDDRGNVYDPDFGLVGHLAK